MAGPLVPGTAIERLSAYDRSMETPLCIPTVTARRFVLDPKLDRATATLAIDRFWLEQGAKGKDPA
ncbi:MAG: hypothetical protein AVDCRST_MAG87-707 [uncultured Thermomicrobiales bacterium]|uniref:Uncharacterized protein n=1 Tax=uncultured Thermomicrobiales bacterium TaxID=1645740 RepID=A0A6J4UGP5_9BACT|nr:MAG: hypothetical protein AVDCRST_MAG87-707 [uncultured Thermomicrobiales bacterium]